MRGGRAARRDSGSASKTSRTLPISGIGGTARARTKPEAATSAAVAKPSEPTMIGQPAGARGSSKRLSAMQHSVHRNFRETLLPDADESRLIAELRNLKSQRSPRESRAEKAKQILEQTNSRRVRNAAALALADLRARNAKDVLIKLLTRADTRGSRGTLLYALQQIGADVPLPILADIIIEEAYEAREEALALLARGRSECSAEEFAYARSTLEGGHAGADAERSEAIQRALDYLRIAGRGDRLPI
jgi:hypothetical protein